MTSAREKAHAERIAVLETEMEMVRTTQTAILSKQDEVLAELSRYRGAFGLATIIFAAIATALAFFKEAIMTKLGLRA